MSSQASTEQSLPPSIHSKLLNQDVVSLGLDCQSSSSQLGSITSNQKRSRTSFIWSHMPGDPNTVYFNGQQVIVWRCGICKKEYHEAGGTRGPKKHLLKCHSITDPKEGTKLLAQTMSIAEAFERGQEAMLYTKRRKLHKSFDIATFQQLFIRWIARCSLPLRMSERPEFRELLMFLNPEAENALPANHETVRNWTMEAFHVEKRRVQQAVHGAISKVHFTVDLWTSTNSLALLGIIAHYFAEDGQLQESVLALRELEGRHTGANQSQLILKVIDEFGIASKVGYFMMDNAENNETMMQSLSAS